MPVWRPQVGELSNKLASFEKQYVNTRIAEWEITYDQHLRIFKANKKMRYKSDFLRIYLCVLSDKNSKIGQFYDCYFVFVFFLDYSQENTVFST